GRGRGPGRGAGLARGVPPLGRALPGAARGRRVAAGAGADPAAVRAGGVDPPGGGRADPAVRGAGPGRAGRGGPRRGAGPAGAGFAAAPCERGRLAFGPDVRPVPAPRGGVGEEARPWWMALLEVESAPAPASAEAMAYLAVFEAAAPGLVERDVRAWDATRVASLAAAAGGAGGPPPEGRVPRSRLRGRREAPPAGGDRASPALLSRAVRAARRALADNPRDFRAQLALALAYLNLSNATRERSPALRSPYL